MEFTSSSEKENSGDDIRSTFSALASVKGSVYSCACVNNIIHEQCICKAIKHW